MIWLVSSKDNQMTAWNYVISHFLKSCSYNKLPLNSRYIDWLKKLSKVRTNFLYHCCILIIIVAFLPFIQWLISKVWNLTHDWTLLRILPGPTPVLKQCLGGSPLVFEWAHILMMKNVQSMRILKNFNSNVNSPWIMLSRNRDLQRKNCASRLRKESAPNIKLIVPLEL